MLKNNKWIDAILGDQSKQVYFAFAITWLLLCQIGFFFLQKNLGNKTLFSLQNQLRQELDFSNFQYLIRSITDFQNSGSIKCSVVKMQSPSKIDILDLRYMNSLSECQRSDWLLQGAHIQKELKSLNGDRYSFDFVSENGVIFYFALWSFRLFGVMLIFLVRRNLILRLKHETLRFETELIHAKRLSELSRTVAHDIRSPLSALNILANSVSGLTQEQRDVLNSVVKRINDIAEDLLKKEKNLPADKNRKTKDDFYTPIKIKDSREDMCKIVPMLEILVQEKKLEYRNNSKLRIEFRTGNVSREQKVLISEKLLFRIVSNIINNSVEAMLDNGTVFLETELRSDHLQIIITDFGTGIPEHILEQLKTGPITYGKLNSSSGSGIGIFSASENLKRIGGDIQIQSRMGIGTKVFLSIPV